MTRTEQRERQTSKTDTWFTKPCGDIGSFVSSSHCRSPYTLSQKYPPSSQVKKQNFREIAEMARGCKAVLLVDIHIYLHYDYLASVCF